MTTDMGKILNSHTVRFERLVPGPIERVFDHLTKPEHLGKWLMNATVEMKVGGRIEFKSEHPDLEGDIWNIRGFISECQPPSLFVYSWIETAHDMASTVKFELQEKGDKVLLVLTHSQLPAHLMVGVGAGWHSHLEVMIAILKGETPPDFYPMFTAWTAKYKVAVAAAGIVVATALAPSAVASTSDPYQVVRAERQNLLAQYDRVWKSADNIKYKIDQIEHSSQRDLRTLTDLDNDLKQSYDDLRRIEQDLRDLDKAML